ncbi:MAG: pantetheine-phosphate adenylyltransferase [Candidatus Sumerlaeota bacterium]|nr:pantetheine-phosphate adenylyltransferase [Candidatus Sumerlaeota bacterium]
MLARIALYPGTFDMPTNGHLNLIHRAARLFPKVIVAVAINDSKKPMLTVEERVELLRRITRDLPTVEVASFQGLTVEFARKIGAKVIVRGLRAVSDFEFELQMALINKQLDPEIETIYLAPDLENSFLSSTATRELMSHGGDLTSFVPPDVKAYLSEKFPKQ